MCSEAPVLYYAILWGQAGVACTVIVSSLLLVTGVGWKGTFPLQGEALSMCVVLVIREPTLLVPVLKYTVGHTHAHTYAYSYQLMQRYHQEQTHTCRYIYMHTYTHQEFS